MAKIFAIILIAASFVANILASRFKFSKKYKLKDNHKKVTIQKFTILASKEPATNFDYLFGVIFFNFKICINILLATCVVTSMKHSSCWCFLRVM